MATMDRTAPASTQGARGGPGTLVARVLTAAGVVVMMGVLAVVSVVVALYTLLADAALDARDQVVRPRPFRGASHGMPFLDR